MKKITLNIEKIITQAKIKFERYVKNKEPEIDAKTNSKFDGLVRLKIQMMQRLHRY